MTFTAHNSLNGTTLNTDNMADALNHIGRHVHVTGPDGMSATPMDFTGGRVDRVTLWAALTGQVRHRVMTGRCKGTVAGWIQRNK